MHLNIEPGSGATPVVNVIAQARQRVDLNVYKLTDPRVIQALSEAKKRGVKVRVILDRSPKGVGMWLVIDEFNRLTKKGIDVHGTPQRFAYDHADYACNHFECVIGTANYTRHGFHRNREYMITFSNPSLVKATRTLFRDDWHNRPAGSGPRQFLMIAPGNPWRMVRLIAQPGDIDIEQEKVGTNPEILHQMERKGPAIRLILPWSARQHDSEQVDALKRSGVRIRYMTGTYLHAKMIAGSHEGYIGSINIAQNSLYRSRDLGIRFSGPSLLAAQRQFVKDWRAARP